MAYLNTEDVVLEATYKMPEWMMRSEEIVDRALRPHTRPVRLPIGTDMDALNAEWDEVSSAIIAKYDKRRPDPTKDRLDVEDARERDAALSAASTKIRSRFGV